MTIEAGCRVTANEASNGAGGGIFFDDTVGGSVTVENDQIVTDNIGGNCFPVDTIPNCAG